ncbi:holin [Erwinia phage Stepyanka]|uniref:Holin n=2 Tax=Elunavirus TaxID=2732681 RepID=G0YQ84_9CAUD|nr:holin [Erwinia phage vB_EamP-L1]AEJ81511.1 holin [Erwinia phage vB_EamP-L1]UTQ80075.1 holin [Erwinia phage Stepyanka]
MLNIDFNNEVLKAAPIAGAASADVVTRYFYGLSLNEWFYVAAIAYTVAQIGAKVVDTIVKYKQGTKDV